MESGCIYAITMYYVKHTFILSTFFCILSTLLYAQNCSIREVKQVHKQDAGKSMIEKNVCVSVCVCFRCKVKENTERG